MEQTLAMRRGIPRSWAQAATQHSNFILLFARGIPAFKVSLKSSSFFGIPEPKPQKPDQLWTGVAIFEWGNGELPLMKRYI